MEIDWEKIESEYGLQNPPDFITHLNYVSCLNDLSKGLVVECKLNIRNKIDESKLLKKKLNLIKLTLKSLDGEYKVIQENPDFAELCVSWISVKAYYLIFNLLLILEYLLNGQDSPLSFSHKELLRKFKERIERGEISFNKDIFNTNFQCSKMMSLRVKSGANIKKYFDPNEGTAQVIRKLVYYKLEDFQRDERIKNFRAKKNRQKKKEFLENSTVNIYEFFYWYRIKANYRDLEFLNKDISSDKFSDFYRNYFELTFTFFSVLKKLINDLAKIRLEKIVL